MTRDHSPENNVHQPLVESPPAVALDMLGARSKAIDEAYDIASKSRSDAHLYQWSCPVIELENLVFGSSTVAVYRVVVILEKRSGLFNSHHDRRIFTFQLDPASGSFVGLRDGGWEHS